MDQWSHAGLDGSKHGKSKDNGRRRVRGIHASFLDSAHTKQCWWVAQCPRAGGPRAKREPSRGSAGLESAAYVEHRRCGTRDRLITFKGAKIMHECRASGALDSFASVDPGLPPLGSRLAPGPPGHGFPRSWYSLAATAAFTRLLHDNFVEELIMELASHMHRRRSSAQIQA